MTGGGTNWDAQQLEVLQDSSSLLRVLGSPGTGRTSVAVEIVARAVEAGEAADRCLVLAPTRLAAADLRDRVTARVGGTSTQPLARTWQSFGFGVLRAMASLRGEPTPTLLSGPEQDAILGELLAGHASGGVRGPQWPQELTEALPTRAFRAELRDLLMRAVELALEPDDLARLGDRVGRPEWRAAAQVLAEYDEVTAFSRDGAYDPAWVLTLLADRLEDEPEALADLRDRLGLIVIDDAQEMTAAAARLLSVLAHPGLRIVLLGDPDSAVQGFRGADPRFLASGWEGLARGQGLLPVPGLPAQGEPRTIVLRTCHRQSAALREVTARVARHIGALGGLERRECEPRGVPAAAPVRSAVLRTAAQEAAWIAALLREMHLIDGVPYADMAVVVRGGSRTSTLRRVLAQHGVPVAPPSTDVPVRDEAAVRPLMTMLRLVCELRADEGEPVLPDWVDGAVVADLLTSPVGGADPVAVRVLRRALRRAELGSGGTRSADELLVAALLDPGMTEELGNEARAIRRVTRALLLAARSWGPSSTAETVLWELWDGLGIAEPLRQRALAGGPSGARADRDLDAVVALFGAASAFVERMPGAGPDRFLEHVLGQDVPGDTLVPRAPTSHHVALVTPAASAGREWPVVVIAGVQEGVWPDLRLRGSLLGSEALVHAVHGGTPDPRAARAAVAHDEARLLHVAVSRASRQLVVTAVRSEDEQPSAFMDLVDPLPGEHDERPIAELATPSSLALLVGAMRRDITSVDPVARDEAARVLATLAAAGVPGADPDSWWGLHADTTDGPIRDPQSLVRVSPSKVESFAQCGLSWFLRSAGGDGLPIGSASIGTLVHRIAEECGDLDAAGFAEEIDRRWPQLGLPAGWLSERQRLQAHEMGRRLAEFTAHSRAHGWEPVAAEARIDARAGRAHVVGSVDRVEVNDEGRVRIIDYKTGSLKPSSRDVETHPQLAAYQLAVEQSGLRTESGQHGGEGASAGAALLQLGKAATQKMTLQAQPPLSQSEDPEWAARLLDETAHGMGAGRFEARPGEWCRICPVVASCPAQPEGRSL